MADINQTDKLIAERVSQLREEMGASQAAFSQMLREGGLNWSQGTLSKVEAGVRPVRLAEAVLLAEVLERPLAALVLEDDFLTQLLIAGSQDLLEAHRGVKQSEQRLADRMRRHKALCLLDEARQNKAKGVVVRGGGAFELLQLAAGAAGVSGEHETRAIMTSLGLGSVSTQIRTEAATAIDAWLSDEEQRPPHMSEALDNPSYAAFWEGDYRGAADGDEDCIEALVDEEYRTAIGLELQVYLTIRGVEFENESPTGEIEIEGGASGEHPEA